MNLLPSHKKIVNMLKGGHYTVNQIADELSQEESSIRGRLSDLRKWGFELKQTYAAGRINYFIPAVGIDDRKLIKISSGSHVYKIALISDTHLCSKHCDMVALNNFYDYAHAQGVRDVFHSGDGMDGWLVYKGQQNEISEFGFDNQVNHMIKNYPKRKGMRTFWIAGNHDAKVYEMETVDPGKVIGMKREDMIYLGQYEADIKFEDTKLRLLHPDGGAAYSKSYQAQRYIAGLVPGEKPNILSRGHLHQMFYMFDRNIHCFEAGCFARQSLWLRRKGLQATIGGWIVEFSIKDGHEINSMKPEAKVYFTKMDFDSINTKREFKMEDIKKGKREYYGENTFLENGG